MHRVVTVEQMCDDHDAGGHFDNYIATYYHYKPGKVADVFFERPDICPEQPPDDNDERAER